MAEEEQKGDSFKRIERGDYLIQVHVIECRELKPRDSGDTNDPVCQVTVMGQNKATNIHERTLSCVFDERLYFDFQDLEADEINQGKVTVELFDANVLFPNVLIGAFEFDLMEIYYREHHELYKQWVALTDVTDANEGVQGYLEVTIVILGPGDEQYIHDEQAEAAAAAAEGGGLLNVLMPPQVEQDPKLLRVHIYRLEKLPAMDVSWTGGTASTDPYVQVQFAGIDNRTTVFEQVQDVAVKETLTIPVMEPVMARQIMISVKDSDFGTDAADDLIGTIIFNYRELKKANVPARWVHLYGAPITNTYFDTVQQDKMNRGVLPGSEFRGSLMMALDIIEEDEPKAERFEAKWNDDLEPELQQYALELDIYQAVECKNSVGRYRLEMRIRDMVIATQFAECIQGTVEWYEIFSDPVNKKDTILLNMPEEAEQCPDILFYLVEESTGRFSYKRFSWGEVINMSWFTPPKWYAFTEDKVSYQYTDEDFPGNVLMGMRAGPAKYKPRGVPPDARPFLHLTGDDEKSGGLDMLDVVAGRATEVGRSVAPSIMGAADTANLTSGNLVLTVMECNYLPANIGDCYVEVTYGNTTVSTTSRRGKTNPQWNEPFTFNNVSIHDELKVTLKAQAYLGISRSILGELERIVLMSIIRDAKAPQGTDFSHSKRFYIGEDEAMITLKFTFKYDQRKRRRRPISSKASRVADMGRPYPANFQMRVYVYQARDLEPRDDNGLSDPYFRVSYCGQKEQTEVINRNLNPQWLQLLILNVQVPQPAAYAPRIQCAVYDSDDIGFGLTGGYFDDMIGRFFVTFDECLDMMEKGKARWFQLYDVHGEEVSGQVYLAMEFNDPNDDEGPRFSINVQTHQYYLHILTLGVRALTSAFGVNKPQIVYTTNKGKEVETDPSSNPDPPNANFRVARKVQLDLPDDFEMAPAINIVAKDQLFGGLVTNILGHGSINLNKFMDPIPNHPENAWNVKYMRQTILNEEELKREEEAEALVELRMEAIERRCERVATRRTVLLSESEMEGEDADMKAMDAVEEYMAAQVTAKDAVVHKKAKKKLLGGKADDEDDSDSEEAANETAAAKAEMEAKVNHEMQAAENLLDGLDFGGAATERGEGKGKFDDLEAELQKAEAEADADAAQKEADRQAAIDAGQVSMEEMEAEKAKKKKSKKAKKKAQKEQLKAWNKSQASMAFDIEKPVPYDPEDDIPKWMKIDGLYRERVRNELEDEVVMQPFENIDLWTGQHGTIGGWNERRVIGQLKGLWRLDVAEKNPFGKGLQNLVQTKTISVRLYVLRGRQLFPMDSNNSSDPYLIVRLGRLEFSTLDRVIYNTLEPKFHESFEFMTKIPGPSKLEIEVWDYDLLGHDLIGTTTVDIEDRWFSKEWRRMKLKPLEERTLHNPRSRAPYGKLELWVDMMSKETARNTPMVDISLPPIVSFQLRVICWKAKHVTIKDEFTEQNDLYCTVQLDGEEQLSQDTDTHFRAKAQRASWNWRMLFDIHLPTERTTHIRFSMWDLDFIGANDMVGEIGFGLDQLLKQMYKMRETQPKIVLKKGGKTEFWLDVFHPKPEYEGTQGKLLVSMELLTADQSEKQPAGLGRSDPNANPFLPPPEGRMIWTLNPFTMLRQILGDKLCAKLCLIVVCLMVSVAIVFMGPQLLINFISKILHI